MSPIMEVLTIFMWLILASVIIGILVAIAIFFFGKDAHIYRENCAYKMKWNRYIKLGFNAVIALDSEVEWLGDSSYPTPIYTLIDGECVYVLLSWIDYNRWKGWNENQHKRRMKIKAQSNEDKDAYRYLLNLLHKKVVRERAASNELIAQARKNLIELSSTDAAFHQYLQDKVAKVDESTLTNKNFKSRIYSDDEGYYHKI